jgi:hypothetical protein
MNTELPAPIAGFFQAHNTGKTDHFKDLFTTDAVVSDEAHEYRGDAIKSWIDDVISKYHPLHAQILSLVPSGSQTIATAQVSGTFPGSPLQLRYQFTIRDDKIAALSIAP